MKKLYFSFIGEARGYKTGEIEQFAGTRETKGWRPILGKELHSVIMTDSSITIYESDHPHMVVVIAAQEQDGVYRESSFLCKRASFAANPAVPVSYFGKQVKDALGR